MIAQCPLEHYSFKGQKKQQDSKLKTKRHRDEKIEDRSHLQIAAVGFNLAMKVESYDSHNCSVRFAPWRRFEEPITDAAISTDERTL